jgi:hypothetical protein
VGPVDQMGRQRHKGTDRKFNTGRLQSWGRIGPHVGRLRRMIGSVATKDATGAGVIGTRLRRCAGVRRPPMADRRQVVGEELQVDDGGCMQPGNERLQCDEARHKPGKGLLARPCAKQCHATNYLPRDVPPTCPFCFHSTRSNFVTLDAGRRRRERGRGTSFPAQTPPIVDPASGGLSWPSTRLGRTCLAAAPVHFCAMTPPGPDEIFRPRWGGRAHGASFFCRNSKSI